MRFFGALLRSVGLVVAFGHNAVAAPFAGQAEPETRSSPPARAAFFKQLGQDPALRARFAKEPRSVLAELGFDPASFRIPEHLDDARLDQFLKDWAFPFGPAPQTGQSRPVLLAADDGRREKDQDDKKDQGQKKQPDGETQQPPEPPAVVYGPPPGLRPQK